MNVAAKPTIAKAEASGAPASIPTPAFPDKKWVTLAHVIPNLLVLALLIGLAWWGHHTGWKLPKFSELSGQGSKSSEDWCAEHSVPESQCVECKADLMPKGKAFGWCKKHGVHECPLCHPEVAQLATTPIVTTADLERVKRAAEFTERIENNSKCKLQQRRIQFASQEAAAKAGIDVDVVSQAKITEVVTANGEITYDGTRVARLSSRSPGSVWLVDKQVGDRVQRGEILALVDAADVGKSKADLLQAFAQVETKTKLLESMRKAGDALAGRTIQEMEAAQREAQVRLLSAQQSLINLGLPIQVDGLNGIPEGKLAQKLQFLGLSENIAKDLDSKTTTTNLLPIRSPLNGFVVSRSAVAGEVVDTAKVLFVVADTKQMWLTLDVRLEDAGHLAVGQRVIFRPDGGKNEVDGKVMWISTAVDEKTRTIKVRADLPNSQGRLRDHTFGSGRIVLREEENAVVVPNDAVQWEGCCNVVFVRDKNYLSSDGLKVFHTRKVQPGAKDGGNTEIIAGLLPGEVVATKGSGVLRSELLKNNLGDG